MAEVPQKKFKYKKDGHDRIMVAIVLFTLLCFVGIFYGLRYFDDYGVTRETDDRNQIDELIENREELEQQLREYLENQDFGPTTESSQP